MPLVEHEEAGTRPTPPSWGFSAKLMDPIIRRDVQDAETGHRPDGGHGGQLAVLLVEVQQLRDIDVATPSP